jgi:hypothetical protein
MYTPWEIICHLFRIIWLNSLHWILVIVGILSIHVRMPGNRSLKDKRRIVKSLLKRVQNRHSVAIAEIGYQEYRDSALLGFCCITTQTSHAHSMLDNVLAFVASIYPEIEVSPESREILRL